MKDALSYDGRSFFNLFFETIISGLGCPSCDSDVNDIESF